MIPESLTDAADLCVKCGLCLPHCPTYRLHGDEAESPRGRIALVQGLASGRLSVSGRLMAHLDHCLLCRACESMCPSQVPFAAIMDGARAVTPEPATSRWLAFTASHPRLLRAALAAARPLRHGAARRVLPAVVRRGLELVPERLSTAPPAGTYSPKGQMTGRVGLFTGCVTRVMDARVLGKAVALLNRLGYEVVIPGDQGCCGAMHQHLGDPDRARRFQEANRQAFRNQGIDAVLSVASGCAAHLAEQGELERPVMDAGAFVAGAEWGGVRTEGLPPVKVALHQPCTLRNGLRQAEAVRALLARFPAIETRVLDSQECCGGGGLQLVTDHHSGDALGSGLIDEFQASGAAVLLTSNTGCALQLRRHLERRGLGVTVNHPVEFVSELLEKPSGEA